MAESACWLNARTNICRLLRLQSRREFTGITWRARFNGCCRLPRPRLNELFYTISQVRKARRRDCLSNLEEEKLLHGMASFSGSNLEIQRVSES